jgi:murein endopeptidase/HEAT repeat protein
MRVTRRLHGPPPRVALAACAALGFAASCGAPAADRPLSDLVRPALSEWAQPASADSADAPSVDTDTDTAPLRVPELVDLPGADVLNPARPVRGTLSLGTASAGELRNAREVPRDGDNLYVLRSHWPREAHYGTDELADLLERVGVRVAAEFPGSRLPLADLSLRHGGEIRNHASHEGGRDVDILFFLSDPQGAPVETTGFVIFPGRDLEVNGRVFDVARNWAVVRALLEESDEIQWVFVSRGLREVLLEHAALIAEPEHIVARARDVLWQPSDSSPHDDHFHVRLFCSRDDRLEGCLNYGPEWTWAERHDRRHALRVAELVATATSAPDRDARLAAIDRLALIDGRDAGLPLARSLALQEPAVQVRILEILRDFRTAGVGREVVGLAFAAAPPAVRAAVLETAEAYPLPDAADMLVRLASGEGASGWIDAEHRAAGRALLRIHDPAILPDVIELLRSEDPELRRLAAEVVARTTGVVSRVDWVRARDIQRAAGIEEIEAWYAENAGRQRIDWLLEAFGRHGFPLPGADERAALVRALARLIDEAHPYGYLARNLLEVLTEQGPPPGDWSGSRQRQYWERLAAQLDEAP